RGIFHFSGDAPLGFQRLGVPDDALVEIRGLRGEMFMLQRSSPRRAADDALIEIGLRRHSPSRWRCFLLCFGCRRTLCPRDCEHGALGWIGQSAWERIGSLFEDGKQFFNTDGCGQAPTAEQPSKNEANERPGAPGMLAEIDG